MNFSYRGENKVGCWTMQPLPPKQGSNKVRCKFQWLMGCNLNGKSFDFTIVCGCFMRYVLFRLDPAVRPRRRIFYDDVRVYRYA